MSSIHAGAQADPVHSRDGHAKQGSGHANDLEQGDKAPGAGPASEHGSIAAGLRNYVVGLGLAVFLTVISFWLPTTGTVWGPGLPVALVVFAIAQMGVHLVFFLHITTGADNTNNVLALAFGVLIVFLLIGGSLWIMANLTHNTMDMEQMLNMQR